VDPLLEVGINLDFRKFCHRNFSRVQSLWSWQKRVSQWEVIKSIKWDVFFLPVQFMSVVYVFDSSNQWLSESNFFLHFMPITYTMLCQVF